MILEIPPSKIKKIEEKLIDNNSKIIIKVNTKEKTNIENDFFSIFFTMPIPALKIKNATAALMPTKAYATY